MAKERPRAVVDRPARRRPADHRRQRPRDRADKGVERRAALERGIDEKIGRHRHRRQSRGKEIDEPGQPH